MKQTHTHTVLKTTISSLRTHFFLFLLLVIVSAGVICSSLVPPQILKQIVDKYLAGSSQRTVILIALAYFASQALISFFSLAKETLLAVIGQKITAELRNDMLAKLNRLPSLYFSNNPSGTTTALFIGDVDAIQSLFTNGIIGLFIDLCKIIGIIISVWYFSTGFGILFLVILPVIFLLTRYFKNKMFTAQVKSRKLLSIVANYIPESLRCSAMIKSFHAESFMERRYNAFIDRTYSEQEHINFYDSIFSPIIQILRSVTIALIAIFASQKGHGIFSNTTITVGMAAAAIDYVSSVFKPVESLGMEIQNIQSSFAGIKRVNDFFAEQERIEPAAVSQTVFDHPVITLNNVSFSYPGSEEKVLDNVSLVIDSGSHVTFRGRTGAGKSTLFRLILGSLSCTEGSLTVGSLDAERIPDDSKRHLFGYVEQSFHFVPGTVRDQITLGDQSIIDAAVLDALKTVGLLDTVTHFENGLDTPADSHLFSQGQLQLLSIARAIVTNPPILLLDEITANLDSTTEHTIITALEHAGAGRTQLCISHRLGAVLASDRIIMIQNGKCVE